MPLSTITTPAADAFGAAVAASSLPSLPLLRGSFALASRSLAPRSFPALSFGSAAFEPGDGALGRLR